MAGAAGEKTGTGFDRFELNKVAGAVLFTVLGLMMLQILAGAIYTPDPADRDTYIVEGLETPADAALAAAPDAGMSLAMLLADASVEAGRKVSRKCASCHTFTEGGADAIGPNLWGALNRQVASAAGFSYSSAMQAKGGAWGYEELFSFLLKPRTDVPGTSMSFAGLRKPVDRANMIVFLRSLAATPAPLPEPSTSAGHEEDAELGETPGGA